MKSLFESVNLPGVFNPKMARVLGNMTSFSRWLSVTSHGKLDTSAAHYWFLCIGIVKDVGGAM